MSRVRKWVVGFVVASTAVLAAPLAWALPDVVVMKDGTRVEGRVVSQELGKWVIVALPDGAQKTIVWESIKEVEINTPPAAATPTPPATASAAPEAAPAVKPNKKKPKGETTSADAKVNADGSYAAGMKHECAENDKACKEQLKVEGKGTDVKAKYESEEDCSDEDDESCVSKTSAEGSAQGVGVSYTKESAKRATGPKNGAVNVNFATSLILGFGDNVSMTGGNFALSVRALAGGKFPPATGGSWFGVYIEPSASMSYVSTRFTTERQCVPTFSGGQQCFGGDTQSSSSGLFLGQLGAGLQWMYFGRMDRKSFKQSGFGLALGGVVGYSQPTSENSRGTATYGPQLSLVFPRYNAGTAGFSSFQINVFVLPTKTLTFILAGVQFALG